MSPEGKRITCSVKDGVTVLNTEDGNVLWRKEEIDGIIPNAATTMFVSYNRNGQIALWDLAAETAAEQ